MMKVIEAPIERLYRDEEEKTNKGKPLDDFLTEQALVILGDPGAGKTTCFKAAAESEPNAQYVRIRSFLIRSPGDFKDKTLYLDGLDEQRSTQRDVMDLLAERLRKLGAPKFRIACRAADWYGSIDKTPLEDATGVIPRVLNLLPLNDEQIMAIISPNVGDAQDFVFQARRRQLGSLLTNPQTLILLAKTVENHGWPGSKQELFVNSTKLLLQETNEHHRMASESFNDKEIAEAAGYLCAVHLLSNTPGFAIRTDEETDVSFPPIDRLAMDRSLLKVAATRRVFSWEDDVVFEPVHRTIAEFLAAQYLVSQLENDLSLRRLLALLTANDGRTVAALRGLYAWVVTLCPKHAATLIAKDPLGIVFYGDPTHFSSQTKRRVFDELESLAKQTGFFRRNYWSPRPFGGLSDPDLTPYFRKVITDKSRNGVFLTCVLDAIAHGYADPSLVPAVKAVMQDTSLSQHIKMHAADALIKLEADPPVFLSLLKSIHKGNIADPDGELRCLILKHLYPMYIGVNEALPFVVDSPSRMIGSYFDFVSEGFVKETPTKVIPELVELFLSNPPTEGAYFSAMGSFRGNLLIRALREYGDQVGFEILHRWLSLGVDKHGHNDLDENEKAQIRAWFLERPGLVKSLFEYSISKLGTGKLGSHIYFHFPELVQVEYPDGFEKVFLALSALEEDTEKAVILFDQAIMKTPLSERASSKELRRFVRENQRFKSRWEKYLTPPPVPKWEREIKARRQAREREHEKARKERVKELMPHLEEIRAGSDIEHLIFLAKVAFGFLDRSTLEVQLSERLISTTNRQIAKAGIEGLICALGFIKVPSVKKIAEAHVRGFPYPVGYAVLAGIDFLHSRSPDSLGLVDRRVIKAGLAFTEVISVRHPRDRIWPDRIWQAYPDLTAGVFRELWQAQLKAGSRRPTRIERLWCDEKFSEIAKQVTIPLLESFPNCDRETLTDLLRSGLTHGSRAKMLTLCRKAVTVDRMSAEKRLLWATTGFSMEPCEFSSRVKNLVRNSIPHARAFLDFLFPEHGKWSASLSLEGMYQAVLIAGHLKATEEFFDPANTISKLIDRIGSDGSEKAGAYLNQFLRSPKLKQRRDLIAQVKAESEAERRNINFRFPDFDGVVRSLSTKLPSTPSELHAFLQDTLHEIAIDIEQGPNNSHLSFWNTTSRGKPEAPKTEEPCRDHLITRLADRLPKELQVEREGYYREDKRTDLKALYSGFNIPVEIKRDTHRDLWRAPFKQLKNRYMIDPSCGGKGIYLVFWFGHNIKRGPSPPNDYKKPTSREEMKEIFIELLEGEPGIEVIVIDCSVKSVRPNRTPPARRK